nr:hypothetical protein [Angustibacter aerolatus]
MPTDSGFDEPLDGRPDDAPWTSRPTALAGAVEPLSDVPRTLVLVGDLPGPQASRGAAAADLAALRGWPLLAEPSSGAARSRALPHGPLLLGAAGWLTAHRPDRVLVVGRPTLSRPVAQAAARPRGRRRAWWPGPGRGPTRAAAPVPCTRSRCCQPTVRRRSTTRGRLPGATRRTSWRPSCGGRSRRRGPPARRSRRTSSTRCRPGRRLLAGSSNAVRELDVAAGSAPVEVVANRGLAGIDGNVSTAAGLALASSRPTYALVGDLTLVHDLAGLVSGPLERRPDLTVVLVDDDGGGIFGLLEPGAPQHVQAFDRVFGTPLGLDLAAVCRALGARWTAATTPVEPGRRGRRAAVRHARRGRAGAPRHPARAARGAAGGGRRRARAALPGAPGTLRPQP